MAIKCSSCGYANYNPDARACELCHAKLKPAGAGEGKGGDAKATAVADSGDELAEMAAAATAAEPDPKKTDKPKDTKDAKDARKVEEARPKVAVVAPSAADVVRKSGPLDVLLFVLSLPVTFPAALFVLVRTRDFAAVPATIWIGQGLLAIVGAIGYTLSLPVEPPPPAWAHAVLPSVVACAFLGSLLLVRTGDTTPGWASAGTLLAGSCLVSGTLLAMRGAPVYEGHADDVRGIDVSRDGARLASVAEDGTLRLWNVAARRLDHTVKAHTPVASSVKLDPGGALVVTGGGDGILATWDAVRPGSPLLRIEAHRGGVMDVDFARDAAGVGRLLSGGVDGAVRVWSVTDGDELDAMTLHEGAVTTVAWSPDGTRAASGGIDGSVLVWEPGRGTQALEHHVGPVLALAWSPEGDRLASGGEDRTVCLWTVGQPGEPRELEGPATVRAVAWTPDGKRVVSAHESKALIVWDATAGTAASRVELPAVPTALAALADGSAVLAATGRLVRRVELARMTPSP